MRRLPLLRQPIAGSFAAFRPGTVASPCSTTHRWFCDDAEVPKWLARYPSRYFDFKAFRKSLRDKKENLSDAEMREVRREYAHPPPDGWTVLTFLEKMKFGDGAEEVADLFEEWGDFISMDPDDVARLVDITPHQRQKLTRHIALFNHGLWPRISNDDFSARFAGKPLAREGEPWTKEEDRKLLELAELYDVNFGDPWIYLSWELQRREVDVSDRYIELVVRPRERATQHELAITKSSRPLLMNRKFRMMPPDLYVVPSEDNFPLAANKFELPAAFRSYRQDDIF